MGSNVSGLKVWIARASIISVAAVAEFLSRFARTAILSRLLAPSEFGTAVAITVVIATAGLVTDVGLDKFVMVRSDENKALAAAHAFSIFRGALIAVSLILSAPYTAAFFGVPQFSGSFAILAIIPFIQAFNHLGIMQMQRHYVYAPATHAQLLAQASALTVVLPAGFILGDHRAIIVSFVMEALVYAIASHLFARTPYRLQSDRLVFLEAIYFGIPLLLNGIGLAMISQFDRLLIGHWFGVSTLATYAVILNVAIVPISLIHRVLGTMGLSFLSSRMRDHLVVRDDYLALLFFWGAIATAYTLFIAVTLDYLTPLVFGSRFSVSPVVHILVMVMAFCGVAKGAPTGLLLATRKTTKLSLLTLSGGFGIVLSLILIQWWPVFEIALAGTAVGSLLSYILFVSTTSGWLGAKRWQVLMDTVGGLTVLAVIGGTFWLSPALTVEARATLLGIGSLAIIAQLALGWRLHKTFVNSFLRSRA
jgi:O-antigen/teichoic acid export membrane protein